MLSIHPYFGRWYWVDAVDDDFAFSRSRFLCCNQQQFSVYNTESIKQTKIYDNRSISSTVVRSFHCQPSSIASYCGSATSVIMIRCRRPHYREQWMGVVAAEDFVNKSWKDNIKELTVQSMSSLVCIADGRCRWAVIAADASVGVPPNDA